jgi:hypothetical protein
MFSLEHTHEPTDLRAQSHCTGAKELAWLQRRTRLVLTEYFAHLKPSEETVREEEDEITNSGTSSCAKDLGERPTPQTISPETGYVGTWVGGVAKGITNLVWGSSRESMNELSSSSDQMKTLSRDKDDCAPTVTLSIDDMLPEPPTIDMSMKKMETPHEHTNPLALLFHPEPDVQTATYIQLNARALSGCPFTLYSDVSDTNRPNIATQNDNLTVAEPECKVQGHSLLPLQLLQWLGCSTNVDFISGKTLQTLPTTSLYKPCRGLSGWLLCWLLLTDRLEWVDKKCQSDCAENVSNRTNGRSGGSCNIETFPFKREPLTGLREEVVDILRANSLVDCCLRLCLWTLQLWPRAKRKVPTCFRVYI